MSAATLTPDEDGWYQISTADELVSLSQSFTYFKDGTIPVDAKIKLMADIDMKGVTGFQPIGDNSGSNGYFQGEFDGNGHIISNLTIEYTDDWSTNLNDESASLYVGFFGYVSDGYIHDLGLVNVTYSSSIGSTGGIVGMMVGGTLENSFVTGQVKGTSNVGGLIGRMRIAPVVKNNYAFVDIIGNNEVGGLVGTYSQTNLLLF